MSKARLTQGCNQPFFFHLSRNRPFPSSFVPLFQNEYKCETFHIKRVLHAVSFSCKSVIFIRIVSHLDSLWNRGTRELGNGLFYNVSGILIFANVQKNQLNFSKFSFVDNLSVFFHVQDWFAVSDSLLNSKKKIIWPLSYFEWFRMLIII